MDRTEKLYKLCLDILGSAIIFFLMIEILPLASLVVMAIAVPHTLNFLFNGQLPVIFKNLGYTKVSESHFREFISALDESARLNPSISKAVLIGSQVREAMSVSSDLDVRVVRHRGVVNGIRACTYVLARRSKALIEWFPLDIYVLDSEGPLENLREGERPMSLASGHIRQASQ